MFGGGNDAGYANQLAAAQAAWAAAKPSCPVYRYETRVTSVFGFCTTTTIAIANDLAISRSLIADRSFCSPSPDGGVVEQWSETVASDVGTHADGAPARTVEQLIAACGQILASDPSKYEVSFGVASNGVPTHCTARLINCVDDCTDGIQIPVFACESTD